MALFKINKGLATNLAKNMPYAKEGFAYFTKDDGKFYIDIDGDGTTTKAEINVNRIPLNAAKADIATMIQATAMATDDSKVYPILAFNITDSTKNLVEAKYSQIGIKNGTLVIPSVEDKDEILISNEGLGRGIVIDNKGTNNAIEILNGKGIKVAQDPTENLELTTKQYVDNQNVVLELNMAGSTYWTDQTSYDFTLSAKAQAAYSRLIEAIEKGYIPIVIIHDIDNTYIYKYSFTQNLILAALLVFTVEIPLSQDGNHMGRDFIAFQSNGSGSTLTVQRLNKPLEYIPGDGKVNQILSVSNNGQATWLDIPSIEDLGGATKDHTHDDRYYTENEINDKLKAINDKIGALLGANDALVFKGIIDGKHPLPTANYEVGHTYRVNEAGTYAGQKCEQGDLIICIADALSTSTPHWTVAQTNIDGAVIGPANATGDNIVLFNGATGKSIKDSGKKLSDFAPSKHDHIITATAKNDGVVVLTGTSGTNAVTYEATHAKKGPNTTANTVKGPAEDVSISGAGKSGSIVIPKVTVDTYGHTTGLTEQTLTITLPNDTHHQSSTVITNNTAGITNEVSENGKTYLNHIENGVVRSTHKIVGAGSTKVSSDGDGVLTITSKDTVYSHPTTPGNIHLPAGGKVGDVLLCADDDTGAGKWGIDPNIKTAIDNLDVDEAGGGGKYIQAIKQVDGKIVATAETIDTTLSASSTKPVQNKAVNDALSKKVNTTTFNSHTGNMTMHITDGERIKWNAAYTHSQSAHAPANAEKNQNAFSNIQLNSDTKNIIKANNATDTMILKSGDNIQITGDVDTDTITINATDTKYSDATTSAPGLMSAKDKEKLDGIASKANNYSHPTTTEHEAAAVKVGNDEHGHVVLGSALTKSDVGLSNVGNFLAVSTAAKQNLTEDQKSNARANIGAGTSSLTIGTGATNAAAGDHTHKYAGSASAGGPANSTKGTLTLKAGENIQTFNGSGDKTFTITASDLGLSTAMHFIGIATVDPINKDTDPTINGYKFATGNAGDVIISKDGTKEYVLVIENNIRRWELLGPNGSYAISDHKHSSADTTSMAGYSKGTAKASITTGDTLNTAIGKLEYKVDELDGAQKNQNAFSNITIDEKTISADTTTDTLTLVAGNNIILTPDVNNDKITIASTNTDTKVTAVGNHYTPVEDSKATLSADASSTTVATWGATNLVTGVNLQRDAKGHVTGVTVDSIKMPANPNINAVTGPNSSTVNAVPTFADTTGKVIKNNSTVTIDNTGLFTAPYIATGTDKTHYFQSRKFRGEGNADTYYHAIDFGYSGHNQVDFHEYGGIWNFYENTKGTAADGKLVASIKSDGFHGNLNGNATSANKVNNNLVIKLNSGTTEGTNQFTYDGSATKNINITPANIGAASSSHDHDNVYVKKAGDTITGDIKFQKTNTDGTTSTTATIGAATGYITGTWLQTTSVGNKVGDFATIDSSGWIYKRTAAQARQDMGLSTAMHFIGKATVDITDDSTADPKITGYTTKTAGDVIIDKNNSYEYVWTLENKWERLGPDGSYSVVGHTHDYLPLSGGILTGDLQFADSSNNNCIRLGAAGYSDYELIEIGSSTNRPNIWIQRPGSSWNIDNPRDTNLPSDAPALSISDQTNDTGHGLNRLTFYISKHFLENGTETGFGRLWLRSYGNREVQLKGVYTPEEDTDAANKYYVDDQISTKNTSLKNSILGTVSSTYVKKSGDTMTGDLTLNKKLIANNLIVLKDGQTYGTSAPTSGTSGQLFFAQDTSDSDYLPLTGGTLSGNLTLNEKLLITNKMYGATKPSNPVEGQIFFQENDGSLTLPAGGTAGQYLVKNSSNDSDASWKSFPPLNYLPLSGGTLTGNLTVSHSDTNDASVRVTNSKGSIGLLSSTNRGLYDYTKSKWLIYTDGTKASTSYALYGAVWNDYAEFREGDTIEAGRCVIEVGDDTLITSTERMMPGANITSDTFGFAIGETEQAKTPIAVSGRALAYPYESREEFKKNIGRPVCSGPNGTVSIMTDEEYRNKGYCAIGTISAVPDYEEWGTGKVKVNGRIWIKV